MPSYNKHMLHPIDLESLSAGRMVLNLGLPDDERVAKQYTLSSLTDICNERNHITFQQKELSATSLLSKIKEEAKTWALAGGEKC
uniref:Uncharacterized protein n=1 Tax=Oryza rufipogon TaxID=4529 RepID=A0A0E0P2A8_ORYRU